jgi:hypothetical protein
MLVGLMVALVGGATDLSAFWKSQLPAAGPAAVGRLEVAILLGAGAGVFVGAIVQVARTNRAARIEAQPAAGQWISMLVVGTSDDELRRIAADLDVEDVLRAALGDLATRLAACPDAFSSGSLEFDILATDEAGRHAWTIATTDGAPAAAPGSTTPVAVTLAMSFPLLLQLLAGTVDVGDAVDAGRVTVDGDSTIVTQIAPYLSERAPIGDRASAS